MMFADLPKFVFFTGKGGVGKTSLACATALDLADRGQRVLLVSTDPASNVGQVFATPIGNRVTPIPGVANLEALEIDPEAAAAAYRDRIVGPLRDTLPQSVVASITEQLSGACTTEIAAFDEFTALLTDEDLVARYDHVIFDTAPTGHTIRLLQLPGAWAGFLEADKGDASCLGPLAGLEKQRSRYRAAVQVLGDAPSTLMILVTRPRQSALAEAARTSHELSDIGIRNQHLALNGLMPMATATDPLARALGARDQQTIAAMDEGLRVLPRSSFPLQPVNLMGVDILRRFARSGGAVTAGDAQQQASDEPAHDWPTLAAMVDELERPGKGLIMVMGKGGVGKTTIAAAVAVELAARGHDVHLTTTDPAAHLRQTLTDDLPRLTVSRIDPAAETARYRQQVLETKGKDLDAHARMVLEEDLRSPCTEEIAVFQAFSRVIREGSRRFVVVDTAPTGHTLLLLDATGSYHRDVVRHAAKNAGKIVTPMMRLQDPEQTRILIVTLPETTPVLEARKLQDDLRRAGITPWGWIVNASLAAAATNHPLLRQRAHAEIEQIKKVHQELAPRFAVVPMTPEEPIGAECLRALAQPRSGPRAA